MDSSDYNLIRVETPGNIFGLEPTQPGQERKSGNKNSERKARRAIGQTDVPDDAQEGSDDPTADQEDPHTVDYKA
jgi:hypothetical protein